MAVACVRVKIIPLRLPLPTASSNLPGSSGGHPQMLLCSVLLPMGFAWPIPLPRPPVRFYRTLSTLTEFTSPSFIPVPKPDGNGISERPMGLACCSLLRFPPGHPDRALPGIVSCGARTFLPRPEGRRRSSVSLEQDGLNRLPRPGASVCTRGSVRVGPASNRPGVAAEPRGCRTCRPRPR